jgi:hypothetical protein
MRGKVFGQLTDFSVRGRSPKSLISQLLLVRARGYSEMDGAGKRGIRLAHPTSSAVRKLRIATRDEIVKEEKERRK